MHAARFLLAGVCFLGAALVGLAGNEATKLVGKWEVVKSDDAPKGATVEFTSDGKLRLSATVNGKDLSVDGTYKIDGKKIVSTITFQNVSKTETNTIQELTDAKLVVQDEKGKQEEYKRVK